MAEVLLKNLQPTPEFGGTPYGNTQVRHFKFATTAAGIIADSNSAVAVGITDTIVLGILRAGMRLDDALMIVSDAFTASITATIGFRYVDGVDVSATPQDADYFYAAQSVATAGRFRANNTAVAPVTLPKDAYLVWTNAGAAHASVGVCDILVYGEDRGAL